MAHCAVNLLARRDTHHKRTKPIARRPHNAPPVRDTGPRVNDRIRAREVRLVGSDGEQIGIKPLPEALAAARQQGLDLVEVADKANPPVCRIMDYGKYKYEQEKKKKEQKQEDEKVLFSPFASPRPIAWI